MICFVCLDDDGSAARPVIRTGCACRGDCGAAHVACLALAAAASSGERWWKCATCKHQYTGRMRLELAEAWYARAGSVSISSNSSISSISSDERMDATSNMASALVRENRPEEAEVMLRRLHAEETARLGPEHPKPLTTAHNLAAALILQTRFCDAERIEREVLATMRRVLGEDHPETLSSAHNLCVVLAHQDKHAEAERMQRAVLAAQRRVLGEADEATLASYGNLAYLLMLQHKSEEAESVGREVLCVKRRVLGPAHPDTLASEHNLGCVLSIRGKHLESVAVLGAALEALRRVLGYAHPHTRACTGNLAEALELGCACCVRKSRESRESRVEPATGTESEPAALRACGRCGVALYCSRRCQLADWKRHKLECALKDPKARRLSRGARQAPAANRRLGSARGSKQTAPERKEEE